MGAALCIRVFKDCTKEELRAQVQDTTDQMAYEDGHSYSGTWASAEPGVAILDNRFESYEEAEEYIMENHEKWTQVWAVKAIMESNDVSSKFPVTAADRELVKKEIDIGKKIDYGFFEECVARAYASKSKFRTCKICGSSINTKFIKRISCPVCASDRFVLTTSDWSRMDTWKKQKRALQDKIVARKAALAAKHTQKHGKVYVWVVGGWCSC